MYTLQRGGGAEAAGSAEAGLGGLGQRERGQRAAQATLVDVELGDALEARAQVEQELITEREAKFAALRAAAVDEEAWESAQREMDEERAAHMQVGGGPDNEGNDAAVDKEAWESLQREMEEESAEHMHGWESLLTLQGVRNKRKSRDLATAPLAMQLTGFVPGQSLVVKSCVGGQASIVASVGGARCERAKASTFPCAPMRRRCKMRLRSAGARRSL
eukprot:1158535-Pelagomonas_calceolata.AAC.5